ncbi:MAG: hypothetical protein IKM95_01520 [Bacteroidales bacterium]|nr:hypothetical protein [Bacteroidales bacterium]
MAPEVNLISFPSHRRSLWMPIAAAASIVIGVSIIGLVYFNKQDNPLPVTQILNEEGHTVRFLCNNGCSAQDILLLANEIFKLNTKMMKSFVPYLVLLLAMGLSACREKTTPSEMMPCEKAALELYQKYAA